MKAMASRLLASGIVAVVCLVLQGCQTAGQRAYAKRLKGYPPEYSELILKRSDQLSEGKFEDAIASFNRSIELTEGREPGDYVSRGMIYRQIGKNDEAIADFTRAIEHQDSELGNKVLGLVNRGNAQRGLGHTEKAMEDYQKSITALEEGKRGQMAKWQRERLLGASYFGLAECQLTLGNFTAARKSLLMAGKAAPIMKESERYQSLEKGLGKGE